MELARIEKLVEKYLNAETTLQEESILKEYFTGDNIAPHLKEYSYMFSYFKNVKEEKYTKTISLEPKKSRRVNFKWLSVAASVVLLFSVFVGKQQYDEYQEKKQAQQIYAQVSKGLGLLSSNLRKGQQAVNQYQVIENKVNKALK